MKTKTKWEVEVREYGCWRGSKVLSTKEFGTLKGAKNYCKKVNSKNRPTLAPGNHIVAHIVGIFKVKA